jgi:hypothetical protein
MKEKYVEIILWQWLKENSKISEVYFNRKNDVRAPIFKIKGDTREIPDLIIKCKLFGKEEYIVVEVKDGDDAINVLRSNKILSIYYNNYVKGKTKYFIEDTEIKINRFVVATQYSKFGKLFKDNDIITKNIEGFENSCWINKIVPLIEYSRTKDFGRMLFNNFSDFRKNCNLEFSEGLGWLISDIILKFNEEELKIQGGMVGEPLLQGMGYNFKLKKWSQFLIKF